MKDVVIKNKFSEMIFNSEKGCVGKLKLSDGIKENDILAEPVFPVDIPGLICKAINIYDDNQKSVKINANYISGYHEVTAEYELYHSGYAVCTFSIKTTKDNDLSVINVGINLNKNTVFSSSHNIKNIDPEDKRSYHRATSVIFSTDERPVTNSIDFLLESVSEGRKIKIENDVSCFIGWEITDKALSHEGGTYSNRWCVHYSGINNQPNKVRGQRIYHWYGHYPELPPMDMLDEMAEYGCSILILHMPSFKWIDGSQPINEFNFRAVVDRAHNLGIKMMFYIQPILISQSSKKHKQLERCLNDNGKLCWHSLKDTQIVFYVPNSDYDCDELCLRCEDAYNYIKDSVLGCYGKYGFDGLYIDFAWPSIAVCTDSEHGHRPGLFNFYDYHRMMREFRDAIGPEGIMIGHGGSLLVSSDYAEGFDACLTGEGQKDLLPDVIGVQTGAVPTLWTMHRRKERQFRSRKAMSSLIREGVTPHIGQGIIGKSILATMDPAHTPHFLALWQIWRAFPVEKATFYNYLSESVIELDNDEITYCMYSAPENQVLIIICNEGGPESESAVSVGVNLSLDINKLDLPARMHRWNLRGTTYENFRITSGDDVVNGKIRVPEIGIDGFIGIILTDGKPPKELIELGKHLDGRPERLPEIYRNKIRRLKETDKILDEFNKLDLSSMTEEEFMNNRVME